MTTICIPAYILYHILRNRIGYYFETQWSYNQDLTTQYIHSDTNYMYIVTHLFSKQTPSGSGEYLYSEYYKEDTHLRQF